ncbi:MAG: Ldh family oxidoreductase [Pseudomonadota bacterium]
MTATLSIDALHALVAGALTRHGASQAQADAVARTVTAAERDGAASHGIFRVPGYVASLVSGKVTGDAVPTLTYPAPAVVSVDAGLGFAPLALETGIPALVQVARETGVAALTIRNCFHFAALWPEVEAVAAEGLVGLAATAATPMVAPAGARVPFFGTNPLAFAFPRPNGPPLVFDQAAAAMARGEIMLAAEAGEQVPEQVGIDAEGQPSTDPAAILGGAQLPFGGYKGSSIALMVELLAGAVAGDLFSPEAGRADNRDGGPPRGGEFLLALDIARFGHGEGWRARSEAFLDALSALDGVRLPGARRHANRATALAQGVSPDPNRLKTLRTLAGAD